MRYIVLIVSLLMAINGAAQSASITPVQQEPKKVFTYVEVMPRASYDVNKYIADNIHYPAPAKKHDIEGRVIVQFVVNEDGTISDGKVLRGVGSGCDDEALRVIMNMPPWIPGKQSGKAVNVNFNIPVLFRLQ